MCSIMIRDTNSKRSQKWFARNNLDDDLCMEYVNDLCEIHFGFKDYTFALFDETMALYISYGLYSYVIYADRFETCLKLLEINSNKHDKNRYHKLKVFFGDSCWFECLSWIKKRHLK